jgi:hypothetical protein
MAVMPSLCGRQRQALFFWTPGRRMIGQRCDQRRRIVAYGVPNYAGSPPDRAVVDAAANKHQGLSLTGLGRMAWTNWVVERSSEPRVVVRTESLRAQNRHDTRMIFAIGVEVLFRARMPSAAACVILGANTRSPRRLIARTA